MHVQQQNGTIPAAILATISKDCVDDRSKKIRYTVKSYIYYHILFCLVWEQGNPHLSSAMVYLLRISFAT